jgi:uncharacterized membrane protein YraQ (UPF0718 family)
MKWKNEWKPFFLIAGIFLVFFYLPENTIRLENALSEAFYLAGWYARKHVILCLVPAFFIAGAISVFVSQASVMKYLGARANKVLAYGVASVSGSVLAVCSCTVLPLFSGIYKMGAGLGPATAFLYSGPAINVLAIILTARVLGPELGIARAVGAVLFSIVIGLLMHFIFRKEEMEKANAQMQTPEPDVVRPLWQNGLYFAVMIAILIFANWGKPSVPSGPWQTLYASKWLLTGSFAFVFALILVLWFSMTWWKVASGIVVTAAAGLLFPDKPLVPFIVGMTCLTLITAKDNEESQHWLEATWGFAKQIMPLLFWGVLVAGLLLGRPDNEGLIPSDWISNLVGGNSLAANLFASVIGAFMYFATLTEVPILQGLIGNGMGKGPALALLLAGPALSLPNMLVIRSVLGTKKTFVFVLLVIVMATISGMIFGANF